MPVDPLLVQQGTLLQIVGLGISLYSARGCTQTYAPIPAAKALRRTINGDLIDISFSQFDKFQSEITCRDMKSPALDGVWPGREVTVYCIAELVVASGQPITRQVVAHSDYVEDGFYHYRPILDMRVVDYQVGAEEWAASVNWKLTLEER
jgi:hypothetical protein